MASKVNNCDFWFEKYETLIKKIAREISAQYNNHRVDKDDLEVIAKAKLYEKQVDGKININKNEPAYIASVIRNTMIDAIRKESRDPSFNAENIGLF